MKKIIKKITLSFLNWFATLYFFVEYRLEIFIPKRYKGALRDELIRKIDSKLNHVEYKKNTKETVNFSLYTPNSVCSMRYNTFEYKEPETLKWIDEYGQNGVLYDVGANIGIYSIYFAKSTKGKVYSFEPSVFNLRQLAKNISFNELEERIRIIPNPLSAETRFGIFTNGNEDEGGALSAFDVSYGYDGKELNSKINYSLMGFSLDDLIDFGIINDPPSIIKVDVDGIEHLILKGAVKTLSKKTCKSVLIEVNDDFKEQSKSVSKILSSCGFSLLKKEHSEAVEKSSFSKTFNQIWVK